MHAKHESDHRLECVTQLAAMALDAPVSVLALVDHDKTELKSTTGAPPTETIRSFMHQLAVRAMPMILTEKDDDGDCALPSDFEAAVGVPLLDESGSPLGSLSVLDYRPRQWGVHELEMLQHTADVVSLDQVGQRSVSGLDTPVAVKLNRQREALRIAHKAKRQLAVALDNERQIVRKLARAFLGRVPTLPGYQIAALYRPAFQADRVGGDFYDFLRPKLNEVGVVMGDVCGKGLSAAVYTSITLCLLRYYSRERHLPQQIIKRMNEALCVEMSAENMFVTLFLAFLNPSSGEVRYVNAGHPAPILFYPDRKRLERLEVTGGVIGVLEDMSFASSVAHLAVGGIMLLFTDGVTEACGNLAQMEDGGLGQMLLAGELPCHSARALVDAIYRMTRSRASGKLPDDVAIVAIVREKNQ